MIIEASLLAQGYGEPSSWVQFFGRLIVAAVSVALITLVIICIYRAAEYFGSAKKEQKLLRIEMGKLAEEVHLLRQELKGGKKGDSSPQSE